MLFCVMSGDILIFMPGQEDIEVTCDLIAGTFVIICIYYTVLKFLVYWAISCRQYFDAVGWVAGRASGL